MGNNPAPTKNDTEPIVIGVTRDIIQRAVESRAHYGTYLQAFNGRNAVQDAYEEAIDLTMYLKQMLVERKAMLEIIAQLIEALKEARTHIVAPPTSGTSYLAQIVNTGQVMFRVNDALDKGVAFAKSLGEKDD